MEQPDILGVLRANREELMRAGIAHVALFGSHARGTAGPDSDIDILIEFAPGQVPGAFGYAGMQLQVAALFTGPVDVVERSCMRDEILPQVIADAIYAF